MANRIRVQVYRFEYNPVTSSNYITESLQKSVAKEDVLSLDPVNALGGQDIPGLGYLYGKITLREPGINQELFVLQTVLQLHDALNA